MQIKRGLLAVAMTLAGTSHAGAALAPNYQRLAELQAILDDQTVTEALKVRPIDRIEFIRTDLYRVTAGACHVDVAIVDAPGEETFVGPRRFKIDVVDRVCPD